MRSRKPPRPAVVSKAQSCGVVEFELSRDAGASNRSQEMPLTPGITGPCPCRRCESPDAAKQLMQTISEHT